MGAAVAQLRTPEKQARFLDALASYGNVTQAAKACGMPRRTLYDWRRDDAAFAEAWEAASAVGADALEDEARRRAFKGTLKPVFQGGEKVGAIREYSDTLLIFLLKGAKPQKYREHVTVRGHVEHSVIPTGAARDLADELLAAVRDLPDARERLAATLLNGGDANG